MVGNKKGKRFTWPSPEGQVVGERGHTAYQSKNGLLSAVILCLNNFFLNLIFNSFLPFEYQFLYDFVGHWIIDYVEVVWVAVVRSGR